MVSHDLGQGPCPPATLWVTLQITFGRNGAGYTANHPLRIFPRSNAINTGKCSSTAWEKGSTCLVSASLSIRIAEAFVSKEPHQHHSCSLSMKSFQNRVRVRTLNFPLHFAPGHSEDSPRFPWSLSIRPHSPNGHHTLPLTNANPSFTMPPCIRLSFKIVITDQLAAY